MEFLVLGPIEVHSADDRIHVGGVRQRSILALLIANRGRAVSAERIAEDIYGEDAAVGARRSVQSIVSMLRSELGDAIIGTGDGYMFAVTPGDAVDVSLFEDRVAAGLELAHEQPEQAVTLLGEALGLWRGDPYAGVDGLAVFEPEIIRLNELRSVALEARIEADLACGRHRQMVPELEALTIENPLSEHLWGLLMLALYRAGRQADALRTYQQLRGVLGEELGIDPSTEVQTLENQILLQDPALDLVPLVSHNLPAQLASFIGRQQELPELGTLLAGSRLVTLIGPGGSGKTRLALELARQDLDDYPDGAWFVDLRGVDVNAMEPLIASTLGIVATGGRKVADQLVDTLSHQRMLLILDNCEHLLDGVAPFVERLIRRGGRVRVLATSRESLGIPGESTMLIQSLSLPERAGLQQLVESEAAVLFAERARSAQRGFVVGEHVDSVFEICRTVDGLPLALELAAAMLVVFSPEELAVRLEDQIVTLKAPQRAGDLRHATIEATIRWSWDLLDNNEQTLLSRLSVFRGTWSMEAAETVCGFDPINNARVVEGVAGLVAKSLVTVDGVAAASTRYRLLEPIRQFAAREVDGPDTDQLRSRFIDYWSLRREHSYDPTSRFTVQDSERATALEPDRANLTAAIGWALGSGRMEDAMVMLIGPFGSLLMLRGSASVLTSRWVEMAIEHRQEISHDVLLCALSMACAIASNDWRNKACLGHAELAIELSQTSQERDWFELFAAVATNKTSTDHREAEGMFDRIVAHTDDPGIRASALLAKSQYVPPRQAWMLSEAAMEISPIDSLRWWYEGHAAWMIGEVAAGYGRYDMAVEMEEHSVELSRLSGWLIVESTAAAVLSWLYAITGRLDEAASLINDAVPQVRRVGVFHPTALAILTRAADIARLQGNLDLARGYVDEVYQIAQRQDDSWAAIVKAVATYETALIARDDQDPDLAAELLDGLAESLEGRCQASDPGSRTHIRIARASVELRRGNLDGALNILRTAMAEPECLFHSDALEAVDLTAMALGLKGKADQAARLKGAIDRERDSCGLVIQPPDIPLREAAMKHAQSALGSDWAAAVESGGTMTLDEAIGLATQEASK